MRGSLLHTAVRSAVKLLAGCALVFSAVSLAPAALESLAPAPVRMLASARADEIVNACDTQAAPAGIFNSNFEHFGIKIINYCNGSVPFLGLIDENAVPAGTESHMIANAPPGLMITWAYVPEMQVSTAGTGFVADMDWTGGQQAVADTQSSTVAFSMNFPTPVNGFGFTLTCSTSECSDENAFIGMDQLQLGVTETVSPTIAPLGANNLWNQGSVRDPSGERWIRGAGWPVTFNGSSPSGICNEFVQVNGAANTIQGPEDTSQNVTQFQQCLPPNPPWSPSAPTTASLTGNGNQSLVYAEASAAGNPRSPYAQTETIHVDSQVPTVSLSGPTQASASAGTQYVTASASVGPSGLGSINCSADGGPVRSYSRSPASIPVSGLGQHSVRCTASNRSYDVQGQVAVSTPATFSIDIGEPTASGISFAKIIHALKCRKVKERVRVAARWVTVRQHGKLVKVHRQARTKRVTVVKCSPRIARRKVTELVKVKRHGKVVLVKRTKIERVVVPPQAVNASTKRVAYGKGTTVSGVLASTDGTALGGRTVSVLTAPDNGVGRWSQAAAVTTSADGAWTAALPAGPSRLVEATYPGDNTTLPSTSTTVHLIVPAKVKLHVSPRSTRWGGKITIAGRVLGGYLPGGKLLRLRIGAEGVRETVGIPSVRRNGAFRTTWKFSAGTGVVRYWFSVSTLDEADYPYASASSRRVYVRVGAG